MKYLLILFILNIHLLGNAQGQVQVAGRVLARADSTPVFNAHVILSGTDIGTSTNTKGYFQFRFDDKYKNSNLLISCIGYNPRLISVTEVGSTIFLDEEILALKEIVVKPIAPEKILKTAFENFKANYYSSDIENTLYYNESIKKDGQQIRKLEIIANVGSKGFGFNHKKPSFFIKQKRPILNKDNSFNGTNGIEVLYMLRWTEKYLKINVIKNYQASFEGRASFLGQDVYRIDLTRFENPSLITSIYITEKAHAIIAIKESFANNKQDTPETSGSAFYFIESIQYVDFMQAENGKWHVNSIDDFRVSNNNDTITEIRRYIKVLSVSETKIETGLSPVNKETDLYHYEASYDKQFWDDFNAPPALEGDFE